GQAVVTEMSQGFQHRRDAEQFLRELRERFARFGLALHPEKTRLLEFGRLAAANRRQRGQGKPATFNSAPWMLICSPYGPPVRLRLAASAGWAGSKLSTLATVIVPQPSR